jgi:serine/threonine-protein kinase
MSDSSPQAALARALAGQYDIEREVGRGGMGIVYRARDVKLDRLVAIKVLPGQVGSIPALRDRFLREARTAAKLSHPNIVPVYRADEVDDIAFFVMGLVEGESLGDRIRARAPLPASEAVPILADVARALAYAHGRGVVHRDVKPENILIDAETGRAMVTDFGIARLADASPLTATGQVLGTVHFMSPEQVSGEAIDGRSDLYSLGVVGYYALSGRLPFDSENASAVLVAHVTRPPPPLSTVAPMVSAEIASVIDCCLAKEAGGRHANGEALAVALESALRSASGAGVVPPLLREDAARAIWSRAAELQANTGIVTSPPVAPVPRGGRAESATNAYRYEDVRAAALEAGIDARHVDRAVAELGVLRRADADPALAVRPPTSDSAGALTIEDVSPEANPLAGAPMSLQLEVRVTGEVRESEFEYLVEMIRQEMNDAGHVSTLGRTLTWSSSDKQRQARITIMPRGGQTVIHVGERFGNLAGGLYGGIMGGAGGGLSGPLIAFSVEAFRSAPVTVAMVGSLLVTVYGVARTIFTRIVRGRESRYRKLLGRLAAEVTRSVAEQPRVGAGGAGRMLPR